MKASCNDLTAFSQSVLSTTKAKFSSEDPCAIMITLILSFETDEKTLAAIPLIPRIRSEEHTSELQSLMRISYAVFCLKKKNTNTINMKTQYDTTQNQDN